MSGKTPSGFTGVPALIIVLHLFSKRETGLTRTPGILTVGSTDRRNALCELFSWRLVHQGFSGPLIELSGDGAELGLAEGRQVDAVWQILAQQAVGVLVGAALHGLWGSQK